MPVRWQSEWGHSQTDKAQMRSMLIGVIAAAGVAISGAAMAEHKAGHTQANADAPGQDRACLVTTSGGRSGQIVATKWLPRKAAQAQADNRTTFVGTNPIVATKAGCDGLNPS